MSLDRYARKFFGLLVAALLGVSVYFQAAGAAELVAAGTLEVDVDKLAGKPPPRRRRSRAAGSRRKTINGKAILARNPFDSVTGPLDRKPLEVNLPGLEKQEDKPVAVDLSDPLGAPACDGVTVNIVSESDDPEWSVAQLRTEKDDEAILRRVGDPVGDMKVAYIGYNAYKASPAVWLVSDTHFCQAFLFPEETDEPKRAEKTPKPAPKPKTRRRNTRKRRGAPKVPDEISEGIQRVSDTEFNVDRGVIDNILENQAQLMRSARIVPEQKDGKTVGIRLFGIRSDTLLGTLGLQNGDRLEKINGFDMASPEKALEAYARLRTASSLSVQLTRRGKPLNIEFQIK